jgi:hypothetical protein
VVPSFEEATDFGVPKSANALGDVLSLGYQFKEMDLAGCLPWKFLRDNDFRQGRSTMDSISSAATVTILRWLFDPTEKRNKFGHSVFDSGMFLMS